jgi:hypothetical protein
LNVSGLVLQPDFVHEARLTPLLIHETFADERFYAVGNSAGGGGTLGRWSVEDGGSESGPSHWEIAEAGVPPMRVVKQTSNIYGLPVDGTIPSKLGTTLLLANRSDLAASHPDQPGEWTDYRFSVQMRSSDDDAIGVVFRRSAATRWYRFSMDRERGYRRLVRAVDGAYTILAEDDFVYRIDQDYKITVEAIGADLAVYQDGELVFRVNDASMDHGTIGLYCWASDKAQFADVRVDDFRATARPVYRYQFTTSGYVHFAHQMHSYQDEVWEAPLPAPAVTLATSGSVASNTTLTDNEDRAWTAFANHASVKSLLSQSAEETTVTCLMQGEDLRGFLVRSPEPIDWKRSALTLSHSGERIPLPVIPGDLKLTGVTRHATDANAESVSLLLREALNPNGYAIEQQRMPGPMLAPEAETYLLEDDFIGADGLLFTETFGANALDLYEIVNQAGGQSSLWAVNAGRISQTSNIYGGSFSMASLPKPGTLAVTGSPDWSNLRVQVKLTSGDNDSIGFVFRYLDADNFYRFEMNREFGYRRLVKKVAGTFTQLWQDTVTYQMNRQYEMEVRAYGRKLYGFIDGMLVFSVEDDSIKRGRVGFYCWANELSHFEGLRVEAVEIDPLLWQPDFSTLAGFSAITAPGAIQGLADWHLEPGGVVQLSNAHEPSDLVKQSGTYLMGGSIWDDHIICARLRSDDDDAIGIMFRVADTQNYYRFTLDRQRNKRRLIKMINGIPSILWQSNAGYSIGQNYDLVIRAIGPRIQILLDGTTLASIIDDDIPAGRIALYCWANQGAHFSNLSVFDGARRIQQWQIVDQGTSEGPSDWRIANGRLKQRANIWGGATAAGSPDKPGTLAISGHADWKNYRLTVLLRSDDNDAVGVVVRYLDAANYYLFAIDSERNYRRLVKMENGTMTTLWNAPGGYTAGDNITLTVDAIGDKIIGYMGSTRLFAVTDNTHAQGKIGLYCWGDDRADFERVAVSVPPHDAYALFLDDFQGPAVAWSIVDKGNQSGPSSWALDKGVLVQSSNIHSLPITAAQPEKEGSYAVAGDVNWRDAIFQLDLQSDDDDAIGVMFRLVDDNNYYRFSMDRERNYRRLVSKEAGVFRVLWEDNQRYETDRRYRLTIVADGGRLSGYLDGILVFDVRDFTHAQGRIGLYCWAVEGARFSRARVFPIAMRYQNYLMEDDFPVLRTFRWQFIDEGNQNPPSAWDVVAGKLVQTGTISHLDANLAFGTLAIDQEHDWEDIRYTAVMRATATGRIGIVFRYQDADHYYRFSLTSGGNKRLIRRIGNQVQELWSQAGGLQLDHDYAITVDCLGARIVIYINGVQVANVLDAGGYSHGSVGLYCYDNIGAEFESVTVAAPEWESYYRFRLEETLAAGTRIRIHSGSEAEPFTADPLEENRFVTDSFMTGDIHFTDPSAQLRVVAPKGPEHTIRFLPTSGFANVDCRLLRKGDGTAFVILAQGNAPFEYGTYKVDLTYRRDNSVADTEAPIFSERGVTDDETAVIIISLRADE